MTTPPPDLLPPRISNPASSTPYIIFLTPNSTSSTNPQTPTFTTTREYLNRHIPYFTTFFSSSFTSSDNLIHLDSSVITPSALTHILVSTTTLPTSPNIPYLLDLAVAADYLLINPLFSLCLDSLYAYTDANELATTLTLLHQTPRYAQLKEQLYPSLLATLASTPIQSWKKPVLSLPEESHEELLVGIAERLEAPDALEGIVRAWKGVCLLRRALRRVGREKPWNDALLSIITTSCRRGLLMNLGKASLKTLLNSEGLNGEVRLLLVEAVENMDYDYTEFESVWVGIRELQEPPGIWAERKVEYGAEYWDAVREAKALFRAWWTRARVDRGVVEGRFEEWEEGNRAEFEELLGKNKGDLKLQGLGRMKRPENGGAKGKASTLGRLRGKVEENKRAMGRGMENVIPLENGTLAGTSGRAATGAVTLTRTAPVPTTPARMTPASRIPTAPGSIFGQGGGRGTPPARSTRGSGSATREASS